MASSTCSSRVREFRLERTRFGFLERSSLSSMRNCLNWAQSNRVMVGSKSGSRGVDTSGIERASKEEEMSEEEVEEGTVKANGAESANGLAEESNSGLFTVKELQCSG